MIFRTDVILQEEIFESSRVVLEIWDSFGKNLFLSQLW